MKTLKLTTALIAMILFSLSVTSCKKESAPPKDVKALIAGYWDLTKAGFDQNNNGSVEQAEIFPVQASQGYYFQFFADGTGNYNNGQGVIMTWELLNDSTIKLKITFNGETTYPLLRIKTLTETDFVFDVTDEGSTKVRGTYYLKKGNI